MKTTYVVSPTNSFSARAFPSRRSIFSFLKYKNNRIKCKAGRSERRGSAGKVGTTKMECGYFVRTVRNMQPYPPQRSSSFSCKCFFQPHLFLTHTQNGATACSKKPHDFFVLRSRSLALPPRRNTRPNTKKGCLPPIPPRLFRSGIEHYTHGNVKYITALFISV